MYWWQRIHFFDELRRQEFADILTFNPLDFNSVDEANENLLNTIRKEKDIDIFLTCVDSAWIYADVIHEIKKTGIPTVLVCWDNLELPYKHKAIAPAFDLVWLTSKETEYLFKEWGCRNIVFQTYASNPLKFSPQWGKAINSVGFIGTPYGSRVNKINELIKNNIDCSVYSDTFYNKGYNSSVGRKKTDISDIVIKAYRYLKFPIGRKVLYSTLLNKFIREGQLPDNHPSLFKNPSVSDEEMCSLYSNHTLSLNITELRDTYILNEPIHKIHLRTFEIPMSGGLQLASYSEELSSYFQDNREILMYRSSEELIDKCRFYLKEENEPTVLKMKERARERAQKEHTWLNRFEHVIGRL